MKKTQGRIFEIHDGQYKNKYAIAYHVDQKDIFLNEGKLVCTVFEDENFRKVLIKNVAILACKLTACGFSD